MSGVSPGLTARTRWIVVAGILHDAPAGRCTVATFDTALELARASSGPQIADDGLLQRAASALSDFEIGVAELAKVQSSPHSAEFLRIQLPQK